MNRRAHEEIGGLAGALAALLFSRRPISRICVAETAGGYVGGILGARLPDVFDPPTSPRHRGLGHGVLPVGFCVRQFAAVLPALQTKLRVIADAHGTAAARSDSQWRALFYSLIELACRLAAGALAGLAAGYVSHLLLDAATPAGLPLIAGRDVKLDF